MARDDEDDAHDPDSVDTDAADASADEQDLLKRCPSCRQMIYADAEQCPYCGQYVSAAVDRKPWWVVAVIAALVVAFLLLALR